MKYVKIGLPEGPRWGVLSGETVKTLAKAPYDGLVFDGNEYDLGQVKLLAPCDATKIVAIGKNYYEHAVEFGDPPNEEPAVFLKPTTCITDPEGVVVRPLATERFDYEGEIALIMKKKAKHVKRADALDYVLGYTCLNDVTARDIQKRDGQWTRGKSFDTCAPVGPIVSDELAYGNIELATRLNGKEVQRGNSAAMMWDIPSLIEYVTATMTLLPGDVLTTGTPVNVGPMVAGDVVEVEIEGIGVLRNTIEDEVI